MDPASSVENALRHSGGWAATGRAFPTPLWTAHAPPTGSTGRHPPRHIHDNASRISKTRDDRDGRRLTDNRRFAPTSVHLRRNPRSRSAESVFNFSGIRSEANCHTFRATGITAYLLNGGTRERAQAIAAHESQRTTKLYDRTADEVTIEDIEKIGI